MMRAAFTLAFDQFQRENVLIKLIRLNGGEA
jgi:hypothetical protein